MLVSIIVPIYKVEQYLDACIQSALNQSYKAIEIILVDDGSPDRCPAMCDKYAQQDARVQVVHKENGGLSDARNSGLAVASGEYVLFLDSDDYWLDTHFIAQLIDEAIENTLPDIVIFGRVDYYEQNNCYINGSQLDLHQVNRKTRNQAFRYLLYNQLFNMSACFLMIKHTLIVENKIYFEKGLLGEDMDWSLHLWSHVKTVSALNNFSYCYRHRPISITSNYGLQNVRDFVYVLNKWKQKAIEEINEDEFRHLVLGYLAFLYPTLLRNYFYVGISDRKSEYLLLKSSFEIVRYSVTKKSNQIISLYNKFGFRFTCYAIGVIGLIKKRGWKGLKLIFRK